MDRNRNITVINNKSREEPTQPDLHHRGWAHKHLNVVLGSKLNT